MFTKDRSSYIPNKKNIIFGVILLIVIFLIIITLYNGYINKNIQTLAPIIPQESEWEDQGIILKAGNPGSGDVRLNGMISPCSIIKKNGTYFLYYVGSDGDRGAPHNDSGPRHRKLGVATSTDGIEFSRYSGNPVLTFSPHDNEEEGIFFSRSNPG